MAQPGGFYGGWITSQVVGPFKGEPEFAPSAGCLAIERGSVLLVQSWQGDVSPPGGRARSGESAQCAAHRETFEETGLDLMPVRLAAIFDTGFHLYLCEHHRKDSGLRLVPGEEWRALWLPLQDMPEQTWRYAGQGSVLTKLINDMGE